MPILHAECIFAAYPRDHQVGIDDAYIDDAHLVVMSIELPRVGKLACASTTVKSGCLAFGLVCAVVMKSRICARNVAARRLTPIILK